MDDDLHTPEAIAVLFDVVRDANRALERGDRATAAAAAALLEELLAWRLGCAVRRVRRRGRRPADRA